MAYDMIWYIYTCMYMYNSTSIAHWFPQGLSNYWEWEERSVQQWQGRPALNSSISIVPKNPKQLRLQPKESCRAMGRTVNPGEEGFHRELPQDSGASRVTFAPILQLPPKVWRVERCWWPKSSPAVQTHQFTDHFERRAMVKFHVSFGFFGAWSSIS